MTRALVSVWRYRRLLRFAVQVIYFLAERWRESTPQEREEIRRHLGAICEVLKKAANREGEKFDLNPDSLVEVTAERIRSDYAAGRGRRSSPFWRSIGQLIQGLRKYLRRLSRQEVGEISIHLRSIYRIVLEIDRRVKNSPRSSSSPMA